MQAQKPLNSQKSERVIMFVRMQPMSSIMINGSLVGMLVNGKMFHKAVYHLANFRFFCSKMPFFISKLHHDEMC